MKFLLSDKNVFEYLISQGICTQEEQSLSEIELKPAKNFNLLVSFPDDRKILVKQERINGEGKTLNEFTDEWQVHKFFQIFPEISHLRSSLSEAIHFDNENSIIVFNYLQEYRDLLDFYHSESFFPPQISRLIGTTLASIHRLTINRQDYQEFFQKNKLGVELKTHDLSRGLERISPAVFGLLPADGLKFFTLYQRYDHLGRAIADLSKAFNACCFTHNDLKLNNILLSLNWEAAIFKESYYDEKIIRFIDWEQGDWGDPANDLGTIIASYLQIWLHSMVTSRTIPIEDSLRLAAIPLQSLQPCIAALVSAYLAEFPEILEYRPNFFELVIQFSGLALIRSIQATLQHQRTFGNAGICILQVAKNLLCRPQASMVTVFGMQGSDLIPIALRTSQYPGGIYKTPTSK